ncbi:hypothetical protein B0I37DRAFT_351885 [Chaetomium sp. MPI-CAGE-AT-0009]|nr:hypothetical protein B0I37DRAFT_351885 [Chaetomium sp. MPI-CAGE-AT-0009]
MASALRSTAIAALLALFADHTSAAAIAAAKCPTRFAWENAQLTDAAIANSDPLFGFGDTAAGTEECKAMPGDASWPSQETWSKFNTALGGALIETVPLAASCYSNWPQYDAAACADVSENWSNPYRHVNDPTSAMWPLYQGRTCLPTDDPGSSNCTLGGYAAYSVAVTEVSHIQLALNFARNANLRLVVKNTGHDFAAKSVGAGALSVWTHKLKDIEFMADYNCRGYSGPAFRLGSGVVTEEVYAAAEENGVTVVGGMCRTVGIAGGYTAGGGHSPMAALVGMAADQILELNVVLPNGRFVKANEDENPDLYWALRGGGGSTYGVVTSVTIRAYPKVPTTTMTYSYTTGPDLTADTFFEALGVYMSYFDKFTSAGAFGYFLAVSSGPGEFRFNMMPMWGANMTKPQFTALVTPFLDDLADLGIAITPVITEYPTMYQAYQGTFTGPESVGSSDSHAASRLFPKENFEPAKLSETLAAVRHAVEGGGTLVGYNIRSAPNPSANQDNSVNPAWRKATGFFILGASWPVDATDAQIQQVSETLTTDWMARWREVSPGAGSYMSEGDINEPDFQQAFYGAHYPRLLKLKKKYDPTGLFYAPTAVGSEDWYVTDQLPWLPTQNGRLCRKV